MLKQKRIRDKGKAKLSHYFKNLKVGEKVAIIKDLSKNFNFPSRMHGKTGIVLGTQGSFFMIGIRDGNKLKKICIESSHLKKLKTS